MESMDSRSIDPYDQAENCDLDSTGVYNMHNRTQISFSSFMFAATLFETKLFTAT